MISEENDKLISQLTIRLKTTKPEIVIGTGILYYNEKLKDKVYVFTAAHCLFEDSENFKQKRKSIKLDLYDIKLDKYTSIIIENFEDNLIFKNKDKDLAVLVVERSRVEKITGKIPQIEISAKRQDYSTFVVKGFPKATQGKELDVIFPIWKQEMTEVNKFQLELTESYSSYNTQGFSGSGVFLIAGNSVYLYGVFTRFRSEDKGKVIYCQFISLVNQLLTSNFLSNIPIAYIGNDGLSSSFFENHIKKSVINLGPRFNERLNFKLPIAKLFKSLFRRVVYYHSHTCFYLYFSLSFFLSLHIANP